MQGSILYITLLDNKDTLIQHLTLSHFNNLCSPGSLSTFIQGFQPCMDNVWPFLMNSRVHIWSETTFTHLIVQSVSFSKTFTQNPATIGFLSVSGL